MVISSADDLLPYSISWNQWSCPVLCPALLGHAKHLHHPWAAVHTPDGAQSYDWTSQASDRFWILLDQLSPLVTGLQIPDRQIIQFHAVSYLQIDQKTSSPQCSLQWRSDSGRLREHFAVDPHIQLLINSCLLSSF